MSAGAPSAATVGRRGAAAGRLGLDSPADRAKGGSENLTRTQREQRTQSAEAQSAEVQSAEVQRQRTQSTAEREQ